MFTRVRAPHRGLTSGGVSAIVRAACARAGLAEMGQVLRHASLLTTAIYAKVDRTALRALALPWPGSAS